MKKIGIVADNYKLDKFKKELAAKGFSIISETRITKSTTALMVMVHETQVQELKVLCEAVEAHFNTIKAKFN